MNETTNETVDEDGDNEIRAILLDQAGRLFENEATKAVIDAVEGGTWPEGLWGALETAGLTRAAVPEAHGGADAGFADMMAIVRLAGRYAAPVPLAETLIAGWLLGRAGIAPPDGAVSLAADTGAPLDLARTDAGWSVSGTLAGVPWGRKAAAVLCRGVDADGRDALALVPVSCGTVRESTNIAGEPRDDVAFDTVALDKNAAFAPPNDFPADGLFALGALSRVALVAGALERVLELSVEHALERRQFGRPIAKFQAIQQELAVLAGEAAAAGAAAEAAIAAVETGAGTFQVAAAKTRAGEAASRAAAIAHQVHGAMGFTYEHPLHQLTRRLWAWRDEFGTDSDWAIRLGAMATNEGGDGLWPLITAS